MVGAGVPLRTWKRTVLQQQGAFAMVDDIMALEHLQAKCLVSFFFVFILLLCFAELGLRGVLPRGANGGGA
jgi:hypothetical protein